MIAQTAVSAPGAERGLSVASRWGLWLAGGVTWSAVVALIAFACESQGYSRAILFPILVGCAVGVGLVLGARFFRLNRSVALIGLAACCGLLTALGENGIGFVRYRADIEEARRANPLLALMESQSEAVGPRRFVDYVAVVARRDPLWWGLDLGLTALGAGLIVWGAAVRQGDAQRA